ncbi:MAG: CPBP family intramembrane metalloprotease [Defluviitaleaceae bacterium]|nr:CPBP family intramembrane metalloprotease [Defluviitaleaceae bacterium]
MNKNIRLLIVFSLAACVLHGALLFSPFTNYLFTSVVKVILFASFPLIYFRLVLREKFTSYIFIKGNARNIKLAFALGAAVFLFIWGVFWVIRAHIDNQLVVSALEANSITQSNFVFVFLYIVVINATLEQVFFRGFIFQTMDRMGRPGLAHCYSSVLFSLYHIPILFGAVTWEIMLLCTVGLIVAGLIFNLLAVKCKNLLGSIVVHVSANLALNLIVVYHLVVYGYGF